MHGRDLRAANAHPFRSDSFDHLPGVTARRILERRARGFRTMRLRLISFPPKRRLDLVDLLRQTLAQAERRLSNNQTHLADVTLPVTQAEVARVELGYAAGQVDGQDGFEHVPDAAHRRSGIRVDCTSHRSGHPGQTLQAGQPHIKRPLHQQREFHRAARDYSDPANADPAEPGA